MPRPVLLLAQHPPVSVTSRDVRDIGIIRRGRLAVLLLLSVLALPARAQPSAADCAQPPDQLTAVICATPELRAAALTNARVFSALRQQMGKTGERALAQEAAASQAALLKECRIDVHAVAPEPGSPAWSARQACVLAGFTAQAATWTARLDGSAKEEAARDGTGLEQGQNDLRALGFLGARIPADGIYRPSTRAAILAWQAQSGRPATGLLGNEDAAALHAAASAPAPSLPASVTTPPPPLVTTQPGDGTIRIEPPGADPVAGSPMRFIPDIAEIPAIGPGARRVIYAEGTIATTTPDLLEPLLAGTWPEGSVVVLSSQGGNAMAGLRMGRMIRKAGLFTVVGKRGANGAPEFGTARCFSACADMFLGGVQRFHAPGTMLGVHKFRFTMPVPEERTEAAMRAVRSVYQVYVREMGVDEAYLDEATRAEARQINVLNPARMAELRVTTGTNALAGPPSAWEVRMLGGRRVLSTHVSDRDGTQIAAFACPERGATAPVLMVALQATRPELTEAAARWPIQMEADRVPVTITADDVAIPSHLSRETLAFGLRLTPRLMDAVRRAERVSVRRVSPDGGAGLGLEVDVASGKRELAGFLAGCR